MQATTTELMNKQTIATMVEDYNTAKQEISQAFKLLYTASQRLKMTFDGAYLNEIRSYDEDSLAGHLKHVRQQAWQYVVVQTGIKEWCSVRQGEELDSQIKNDDLPELTVDNMWNTLNKLINNTDLMFEEALQEVWDFLHPNCRWKSWKTNSNYDLGLKVIHPGVITYSINCEYWSLSYYRQQEMRALDNIFHLLDGRGIARYPNDLYTTISHACNQKETECETEYFHCKWYKKGTIHITLKREDLVKEFNRRVQRMQLKDKQPGKHEAIVRASV
ncbi:DUF4942 domain-containing protein [Planctomycetota bacterium]